jgi:hypothetical protein
VAEEYVLPSMSHLEDISLVVSKEMHIVTIGLTVTVHDADYRTALKDWETCVGVLSEKLAEVDDTIPELPVKDLVCHPGSVRTHY